MKRALIGVCNNVTRNMPKIKVWADSFKAVCLNDDVLLLTVDATEAEVDKLINELDISVFNFQYGGPLSINDIRLKIMEMCLAGLDYDFLIATDVFDVIFQANPFTKLEMNKYDIFVSGEGIYVREEPWNADVIGKCFPDKLAKCLDKEVICSGVIAGNRKALCDLYKMMYETTIGSLPNHEIRDQAALIVLIADEKIPNLKVLNLNDTWAVHCAVAGPTNFFIDWGFREMLKKNNYSAPYLLGDTILINNTKVDIVHQFNRIQQWYDTLTKKYE